MSILLQYLTYAVHHSYIYLTLAVNLALTCTKSHETWFSVMNMEVGSLLHRVLYMRERYTYTFVIPVFNTET